MSGSEPPEFVTERLRLRAVRVSDARAYEEHFVDYQVVRHLSAVVPWPYPRGGVRTFIVNEVLPNQGRNRWVWGIFLREAPESLIGAVDLWRPGRPENRGFWLGRSFWGRGLMTEAVAPVTNYAFDVLGFDVLTFSNALGNVRSRRVKEKTGARLVRVERAAFVDPRYTQHEVWELRKEDWLEARGAP